MRIVSLICLMVVAPLAVLRAATPLDTQYRFQVENGIVTLFHLKSGKVLERTSLAEFNFAPTRDKLRHLALNLTAAVVCWKWRKGTLCRSEYTGVYFCRKRKGVCGSMRHSYSRA